MLSTSSKLSYMKRMRRMGSSLVKKRRKRSKIYFEISVYLVSFIILLFIHVPQLHVPCYSKTMLGEGFHLIIVHGGIAGIIWFLQRLSIRVRLIDMWRKTYQLF